MKIDVEGSELSVLLGGKTFFRHYLPRILLELNPASSAAAGVSVAELVQALSELGYDCFTEMKEFPRLRSLRELELFDQRNVIVTCSTMERSLA